MSNSFAKIAVIGAGSWGTALAILFSNNGHPVTLWGRNKEKLAQMQSSRENTDFLPNCTFPELLNTDSNLLHSVSTADIVLLAIPSHAFRAILKDIKVVSPEIKKLAWATKGLEFGTQQLLHQVVIDEFGDNIDMAVISGPTFATEVAHGLPTAVTIASNNKAFAKELAHVSHNSSFRPYVSDDLIGLEIGGAVKNVLAIAAGIADGLGYGANTRAALITRGIAEMTRLAVALGAHQTTLMGLSGIGDLLLTCTDNQSRNRRMGLAIGHGQTMLQAHKEIKQVVEGVEAAQEVYLLSQKINVEVPIVEQVYLVLYKDKSPKEAVKSLLGRSSNYEKTV